MDGCCTPGGACTGACIRTRWECTGESNANGGSHGSEANGGWSGYCLQHGVWYYDLECMSCASDRAARPLSPSVEQVFHVNILESPPEGFMLIEKAKLDRLGDTIDSLIEQLVDLLP